MNLLYGEIVDLQIEGEMRIGSVRVAGAIKKVPLDLISDARCGDTILICDGVAIAKVAKTRSTESPDERVDSFGFRRSTIVI